MKKEITGYNVAHVDKETGEIICETEGCTYISDDQKENENQEETGEFCEDVSFVKLHSEIMDVLKEVLTPTEYIFFLTLSKYISYTDCVIRLTPHGNSKPMDMHDMAKVLKYDYSNVRKIVASLKKKGLIGKHETGALNIDSKMKKVYTVNPYVYFRGRYVNKFVAEFYKDSGWPELLNREVKIKEK